MMWLFTDTPSGINLSIPLMINRFGSDMTLYGVDPAFLHELSAAWVCLRRGFDSYTKQRTAHDLTPVPRKEVMPRYPSAYFMGSIGANLGSLASERGNPNHFFSWLPESGAEYGSSSVGEGGSSGGGESSSGGGESSSGGGGLAIIGLDYFFDRRIKFGEVPYIPGHGDPVRIVDIKNIYNFLDKEVNYICYTGTATSKYSYWRDDASCECIGDFCDEDNTCEGYEEGPFTTGPNMVVYTEEWLYQKDVYNDGYDEDGYHRENQPENPINLEIVFNIGDSSEVSRLGNIIDLEKVRLFCKTLVVSNFTTANSPFGEHIEKYFMIECNTAELEIFKDGSVYKLKCDVLFPVDNVINSAKGHLSPAKFKSEEYLYKYDHGDSYYLEGGSDYYISVMDFFAFPELNSDYKNPNQK